MDPIDVTLRWEAEGRVTPLDFTWRDSRIAVESTGRRWQDAAGLHVLVLAPGGRVFELVFSPADLRWYLQPRLEPAHV